MPNHSRKNGNKLTSSSIASRIRKNTMDALLQRQHNLSSKRLIKLEKKLDMTQTYLLESPPPRNSRTKPSSLYLVILFKNKTFLLIFGDFGAVPEILSGTVQREDCLEKKQCVIF